MKKYFLLGALAIGYFAFAQNYPYYGNQFPNDGYYQNDDYWGYDDDFYNYAYSNFPDSYYYEYPSDYYPSAYYKSYYNDYRQSILGLDWDRIFIEFNLNQSQIRQIIMLNRRFPTYSSWNSFYGMNPDRWYYDRFYILERILGPRIFIVFQNRYYNGYSPVRYWQNYRRTYYIPHYQPIQRYRSINSNTYNVGRDRYFRDYGNRYGWSNTRNPHNPGGLNGDTYNNTRSRSYRNERTSGVRQQNDSPFRTGTNQNEFWRRGTAESATSNSGWQNESRNSTRNGGGFRNGSAEVQRENNTINRSPEFQERPSNNGFRSGSTERRPEGSNASSSVRNSGGMRTGGFR